LPIPENTKIDDENANYEKQNARQLQEAKRAFGLGHFGIPLGAVYKRQCAFQSQLTLSVRATLRLLFAKNRVNERYRDLSTTLENEGTSGCSEWP
jgi:hypothetical protein